MITQLAAGLYVLAILAVIGFQIGLIAGAPWGHLTQGGRHEGPLPTSGRVAAGASVLLLACMGLAVASSAGLAPASPAWAGWVAVGVQALATAANWLTPSPAERRLWAPTNSVMLGLAAFVVLWGP